MSSSQAPVVDRIRIIPRPDDFLDRQVGNSGEVFYDKAANSLRVYSGKDAGGFTLLTSNNLPNQISDSGISTVSYNVTVGTDPDGEEVGNKYFIDGEYKPQLNLVVGYTYVFNQDDQTNEYFPNAQGTTPNQHPLNFSADNQNGELAGGTAYLENVVYKLENDIVTKEQYWDKFSVSTQRSVQISITSSTPKTLYYWCQQHANMGNVINVANPGTGTGAGGASVDVSELAPTDPTVGNIWFNSTTGRLYVYIDDGDTVQWVQPSVPASNPGLTDAFTSVTIGDSSQLYAVGNDTLNFIDGPGIELSTDSTGNTIIISATGSIGEGQDVSFGVVSATSFVNTGLGTPTIDSASTITLTAPDGIVFNNILSGPIGGRINIRNSGVITENTVIKSGANGTVEHDCDEATVFYHQSMTANFTPNFINVPLDPNNNSAVSIALVILQGATPYMPTSIQIEGVGPSIRWQGGSVPSGTANGVDVVSFTILFNTSGSPFIVLGSSTSYS